VFLALMAPTVAPVEVRSTGDAGLLPLLLGVLAVAIFGVFLFLVRRRRGRRK
jgi:LPXTG-motif cell wall-anchored protein